MPADILLLMVNLPPAFRERLSARFEILGPFPRHPSEALSPEQAGRVTAVVTFGSQVSDATLFDALPNLKLLCCWGTGFERVDLAAAKARGITATHNPGANATAVADHAMALMLASIRRVVPTDRYIRTGQWQGNAVTRLPVVRGLTGRRVGIYGLGAIGEKVAKRAAAFEMEIGYCNRRKRDDVAYAYFPTLLELATWADVLVVGPRADAVTHHSVNATIFRALGPDGHVINIARGSIIDEAALIEALQNNVIAGAGLDVFEHEPQVPEALRQLENAVLTPHTGAGTQEAREAMLEMTVANIEGFFDTGKALAPIPE
ncbi:2-hydroxyacid dehydrogenase [Ferrovibrio xuzhouensis]|uniref:2-hydroxyacid dehydrogenase n=1 Tax=Ferrovibrio xuzhouensis TaxID=1576914 RepID=A0ABV7VPV0_9PROT